MARFIQACLCVALVTLWLPAGGFSGETGTTGKQPAVTPEKHNPPGSNAKDASQSTSDSKKQLAQQDIQTRGLLSKKKSKTVGGAAGHTASPELGDLPMQSESQVGK